MFINPIDNSTVITASLRYVDLGAFIIFIVVKVVWLNYIGRIFKQASGNTEKYSVMTDLIRSVGTSLLNQGCYPCQGDLEGSGNFNMPLMKS